MTDVPRFAVVGRVNKGKSSVVATLAEDDTVRIDAIYNPVRRANFTVAETRVGQRTDYDRLVLTVETNGTVRPDDAIAYAARILQDQDLVRRIPVASHVVAYAVRLARATRPGADDVLLFCGGTIPPLYQA